MKYFHSLLFLFFTISAVAQEYSLIRYGIEDGLAASRITAIYQDRQDFLWIGTAAGVSRFDGQSFENFTVKDGLFSNNISSIHEDEKGALWLRASDVNVNDLILYDGRKFRPLPSDSISPFSVGNVFFSRPQTQPLWIKNGENIELIHPDLSLELTKYGPLKHNNIYALHYLSDQHYYLGTLLGLIQYKDSLLTNLTQQAGRTTQVYQIQEYKGETWLQTDEGIMLWKDQQFDNEQIPSILRSNITHSMLPDSKGNLWFATIKGLFKYDGHDFTQYTTADGLPYHRINKMYIDSKDRLWLSTNAGLALYDGKEFYLIDENEESDRNARFTSMNYREILEDHEGNIWFNIKGGLARFGGFAYTHYSKDNLLKAKGVSAMLKDSKGRLWLGYYNKGLSICEDGECEHFDIENGLLGDWVKAIVEDTSGTVWLGFYDGLMKYEDGKFQTMNFENEEFEGNVTHLATDSKGQLWIGANRAIFKWDGTQLTTYQVNEVPYASLPFFGIAALLIDRKDQVWASTREGIYRMEQDSFKLVGSDYYFGLVIDMAEDADSNIWMVKAQGGIMRFDGKFRIPFTEMDGLSNNNILSITIHDNTAWLGTITGVDKLDIAAFNKNKSVRIENIGRGEGFIYPECTTLAYTTGNGEIWFGTNKGLTRYDASKASSKPTSTPHVYITDIKLNYEPVDWIVFADTLDPVTKLPENLVLEHDENTLTFSFDALSFVAPEKVRFQYQLEGLDSEWQLDNRQRLVTYPRLSAGQYTFKVKVADKNAIQFIPEASFTFTITKAYWQEAWFIALLVLSLFFIGWLAFAFLKFIKRRRKARVEQAVLSVETS